MVKVCEICDTEYNANRSNQRYCPDCGKNPENARRRYIKAEIRSKAHAGDRHKPREYTCKVCGKKTLSTYNRTFCSDACLQLHIVNTAKCPVCGVLLVSRGRMSGKGCCSEECTEKLRVKTAIANGRYRKCEYCGEAHIAKTDSGRFCSIPCYRAWFAEHKAREDTQRAAKTVFEKRCRGCGKVFTHTKESASRQYCSAECRIAKIKAGVKAAREEKQKDENLCLTCKTSQAQCERFKSNFTYLPCGAVQKTIKGKAAVVECPKFR